jgi:hypothetical protein
MRIAVLTLVGASLLASGPASVFATPALPQALPQDHARGIAGDPAPAPVTTVKAEVIILHATNAGKGIDPTIGKLPELLKPPFSSYDTYKLIEKGELELPKGAAAKEKALPDGGKLGLSLKDIFPGKKRGEPTRYLLSASLHKPDGKAFLPALDVNAAQGEYFFMAGQKYQGGILVIGVRIR